jgi:dipeptidyl aminopeptidase/acylaminoacyl peptidase
VLNPLRILAVLFFAASSLVAEESVRFGRDIAPVLQARCLACHRAEKARGRYRLDTFEQLMKPGAGGEAPVVAGNSARSVLHRLLLATDPDDRMPQESEPLGAEEIARIRRWIDEGARFDGADPAAPLSASIPRPVQPAAPSTYGIAVPVAALAFSPDGAELAMGGVHEVLVRASADGVLKRRLGGFPERVLSLSWPTNGARLAVAGGSPGRSGEAVLVDPSDGRLLSVLRSLPDVVTAVRFSPDGSKVAVGGTDSLVTLHDAATGARLRVLPAHADWVLALDWSADGKWLVSASRDRTVRVADAVSGEAVASFTEHAAPVFAAVFTPDAKRVLSAGRDRNLRLWDAVNSESRNTFSPGETDLFALLALPDGALSAGSDGVVRLHPWASLTNPVRHRAGGRLLSLAADPAGGRFAAGAFDGTVRVWMPGMVEPQAEFQSAP